MAKKPNSASRWMQTTAVRLGRVHFVYILAFFLSVVVFDASNLYTYQAISQLWTAGGVMLTALAVIWFISRLNFSSQWIYIALLAAIILADIAFASYIVWWQHGLYSKSVALYAVPIITAAAVRSRSLVFATAAICAACYSTISVRYFFDNYGLGYRVELWTTIGFFSAMFFVLALLLMIIINPTEEKF